MTKLADGSLVDIKVTCNKCRKDADLVSGKEIYPNLESLEHKKFWLCRGCGDYVGTHKDSKTHKPLGNLADTEGRLWKCRAHAAFDRMLYVGDVAKEDLSWLQATRLGYAWLDEKGLSRSKLRKKKYAWLAEKMGIKLGHCHIGFFSVGQCKRVIDICDELNEQENYIE